MEPFKGALKLYLILVQNQNFNWVDEKQTYLVIVTGNHIAPRYLISKWIKY